MESNSLTYSIPMRGNGDYNAHSDLQRDILKKAVHLLHEAAAKASLNPLSIRSNILRVTEYGCSHGKNSIPPLEAILKATDRETLVIELNDRPENDFTTLSLTIDEWERSLDRTIFPHNLFLSFKPASFYRRLSASQDVDLGFCFTCLHFLEDMPNFPDGHFTADCPAETVELFRKQAQADLQKFLRLRAAEFVQGGQLLLSLISSSSGGHDFADAGPADAVRLAIREMYAENKVSEKVIHACVIPIYFRSQQDILETLDSDEMKSSWSIIKMEPSKVMHPFWTCLDQQIQLGKNTEAQSVAYASAMLTWFLTVFEGFFSRALICDNQYSPEDVLNLVQIMREKALRIFLENYKDNPVYLKSLYVHLEKA